MLPKISFKVKAGGVVRLTDSMVEEQFDIPFSSIVQLEISFSGIAFIPLYISIPPMIINKAPPTLIKLDRAF